MGGAAMVLARASRDHALPALLLVDPPLSGSDYLGAFASRRPAERQAADETLGVQLPATLRQELTAFRLLETPPRTPRLCLLATAHAEALRALVTPGARVAFRECAQAADPRPAELEEALLSNALPSEIAAFAAAELMA
jgi:hypothetical protein